MNPGSPSEVVGRRIVAALVDFVVIVVLLIVVGLAFGEGHSGSGSAGVNLHGLSAIVFLVLVFGYFFGSELAFGQTLGKRLFRIRVVSREGQRPSAGAIAARTLLRVVDFLPFLYLVGLITITASRHRGQRLGDLAARTTVVES